MPMPSFRRRIVVSVSVNGYDVTMIHERAEAEREDPPPFLRTWNRLYTSVIVYTCVLVLALYLMTITLNR